MVAAPRKTTNRPNILWRIRLFAHNRVRSKSMANREMAQRISYVINGIDKSGKKLLTVQTKGETITPQQSFLDFFSQQDLTRINPAKFIQGFIELFTRNGDE